MPCLFGGSGTSRPPAEFVGHFEKVFGAVEQQHCGSGWVGGAAHHPAQATRTDADGTLLGVFGERSLYRALGQKESLHHFGSDSQMAFKAPAPGALAVLDPSRRSLSLAADWMSFFPLYFGTHGSALFFSSQLKPLAELLEAPLDPTGIAEFLYENATLNGRTLFKGIHRLLPGQSVTFGIDSQRIHGQRNQHPVEPKDPVTGDVLEQVWHQLLDACGAPQEESVALMLSGGWDSRTLLAALVTARRGDVLTTATHRDHGQLSVAGPPFGSNCWSKQRTGCPRCGCVREWRRSPPAV